MIKINLPDSVISPDWLKYGFAGLVAIFGILKWQQFGVEPAKLQEQIIGQHG